MSKKLIESQEKFNDSILELMCLTFNKKQMQQLIDAYIKSNKLTNDILALKEDKEPLREVLDNRNKIFKDLNIIK